MDVNVRDTTRRKLINIFAEILHLDVNSAAVFQQIRQCCRPALSCRIEGTFEIGSSSILRCRYDLVRVELSINQHRYFTFLRFTIYHWFVRRDHIAGRGTCTTSSTLHVTTHMRTLSCFSHMRTLSFSGLPSLPIWIPGHGTLSPRALIQAFASVQRCT